MRAHKADSTRTNADRIRARVEFGRMRVRKYHSPLSIEEDDGQWTAIEKVIQRLDHRQHRRIKRHA
jgi:hypothetical protein